MQVNLLPELIGSVEVKLKREDKTVIIYLAEAVNLDDCEPRPLDGENHDVRWWSLANLPSFMQSQDSLREPMLSAARKWFSEQSAHTLD